jgi:hypothetical protein
VFESVVGATLILLGAAHRQADRGLPPQVEGDRVHCLPALLTANVPKSVTVNSVRQAMQRLQHDDRGDHVRRHAGATPPGGKQVRKHLVRKQPPAMLGQKREHAAGRQQVPGQRLDVAQLAR